MKSFAWLSALPLLAAVGALAQTRPLPLGDHKTAAEPRAGYVLACQGRFPGGGGASRAGEWIAEGFWNPAAKPVVEGRVLWPDSSVTVAVVGDRRVIAANNLPAHPTGEFPIRPGSRAYAYDRNPNRIAAQPILLSLPAAPAEAARPACVPMGLVGFTLSGAALFNAFDLAGRDAPAYEIQDPCNGHPERGGQYHYHDWSACVPDPAGDAGRHSSLAGYMLDGFGIYGPKGEGGRPLASADLDACHGHAHAVSWDGREVAIYHYHFTPEYPYTIGCFRGTPVARRP